MLKRYFEIKAFVDEEDPDLACNLSTGNTVVCVILIIGMELLQLQKLMKNLLRRV
jgi:hypothetical protein